MLRFDKTNIKRIRISRLEISTKLRMFLKLNLTKKITKIKLFRNNTQDFVSLYYKVNI